MGVDLDSKQVLVRELVILLGGGIYQAIVVLEVMVCKIDLCQHLGSFCISLLHLRYLRDRWGLDDCDRAPIQLRQEKMTLDLYVCRGKSAGPDHPVFQGRRTVLVQACAWVCGSHCPWVLWGEGHTVYGHRLC